MVSKGCPSSPPKRKVFSFHETILSFGDWIPRENMDSFSCLKKIQDASELMKFFLLKREMTLVVEEKIKQNYYTLEV